MVLIDSAQAHNDCRFTFAVIPLWLLIGADLATRFTARLEAAPRHSIATFVPAGVIAAAFAAVSVAAPSDERRDSSGRPPPTVVRSEVPVPNPAMPQIPSHSSGIPNPYGYTFTSEPVSVALPSTSLVDVRSSEL